MQSFCFIDKTCKPLHSGSLPIPLTLLLLLLLFFLRPPALSTLVDYIFSFLQELGCILDIREGGRGFERWGLLYINVEDL